MGLFSRKKDKLPAPDKDPRSSRPSDPGVHRGRNSSRGPSHRRDYSAPNRSHNRSPDYRRDRRNSSFDETVYRHHRVDRGYPGGGGGLPPPRNAPRSPTAIEMDHGGVSLKSGDGSAIRMRPGGLDLTSQSGQTISLSTGQRPPPPPCAYHSHGGPATYTCYDPNCPLASRAAYPAVMAPPMQAALPMQQTYTTTTMTPIAPMTPMAPVAMTPMPTAYTAAPAFQMPAQGTLHNVGGVPVVIPVNRRR